MFHIIVFRFLLQVLQVEYVKYICSGLSVRTVYVSE